MLERTARLHRLPLIDQEVIRLAQDPLFPRWLEQITATGGCAHPIHLTGSTTTHDASTGELLHHYDTSAEPGGRLLVRCRNRRATVCPPCSRLHAGDTFHLVRAGLLGGKNVPAGVRTHPRLFITLTPPSFGAVHRATDDGPCRPRRAAAPCEHGKPVGCHAKHAPDDKPVGQPLCVRCYDYTAHVLWHAHAGRLWKAFTDNLYNHLAAQTGRTRSGLRRTVRLSYSKVAEFQRRAAVHVHAVLRLDGADGPDSPPPSWISTDQLTGAVRSAAAAVQLSIPDSAALGTYELRWGAQLDVRPLKSSDDEDALSDEAVAAYVAKYVTKGAADTAAGLDHRVASLDDITCAPVSPHIRTLMATGWRLGGLAELEPLRLRAWAHSLGYRGHILTKSRAYSTTYAALREERALHQQDPVEVAQEEAHDAITDARWRYAGSGHSPGAALIAAGIAEDLAANRDASRESLRSSPGGAIGAR